MAAQDEEPAVRLLRPRADLGHRRILAVVVGDDAHPALETLPPQRLDRALQPFGALE